MLQRAPPHPGGMPGPSLVPPRAQPNPAFAQWMQANQQRQAIVAQNAQKQTQFDAACALIRSDGVRGFKLDIEADSTIAPDEDAERAARTDFLREIVPFMEQIVPLAQGNPDMADLMSQVAMFAVRGFRVARPLEEAFEKAFKVLGTMPPVPPKHAGKQTDPQTEQAKIMADVHDTQVRAQQSAGDNQTKMQIAQMTLAQKAQQSQEQLQEARERMAAEAQHNAMKLALEAEKLRSTERVQAAKATATEARGAQGLV